LAAAIAGVRRSTDLYVKGNVQAAHAAAVDAYLEGFELVEAPLGTIRPELVLETENALTALRQAIRRQQSIEDVRVAAENAVSLLENARDALANDSLSPGVAFISALVIMLRE